MEQRQTKLQRAQQFPSGPDLLRRIEAMESKLDLIVGELKKQRTRLDALEAQPKKTGFFS